MKFTFKDSTLSAESENPEDSRKLVGLMDELERAQIAYKLLEVTFGVRETEEKESTKPRKVWHPAHTRVHHKGPRAGMSYHVKGFYRVVATGWKYKHPRPTRKHLAESPVTLPSGIPGQGQYKTGPYLASDGKVWPSKQSYRMHIAWKKRKALYGVRGNKPKTSTPVKGHANVAEEKSLATQLHEQAHISSEGPVKSRPAGLLDD